MSVIDFVKPGQSISLSCNLLLACETITVDARRLNIKADSIYVGNGATIQNVPPQKAQKGTNGINPGDAGKSGARGAKAFDMNLEGNKLLQTSVDEIIFISQVS